MEQLSRNRVAIKVEIYEGSVSGLRHINIIGNSAFDDEELLDLLELRIPKFSPFFLKMINIPGKNFKVILKL